MPTAWGYRFSERTIVRNQGAQTAKYRSAERACSVAFQRQGETRHAAFGLASLTCQCAALNGSVPWLNRKGQCLIISIAPALFRIWKPVKLYN